MSTTLDTILNGQIQLHQPATGYRVAIDPIFLAAAIDISPGDEVLDVGTGVGAASLCLAHRVPFAKITGLEVQLDYVRLASENIRLNRMSDRIQVLNGDLLRPPPRLAAGTFSHVMTNPPYYEAEANTAPPNAGKAMAHVQTGVTMAQWVHFCLLMLRPKGTLSMIYRADGLGEVLSLLQGKVGDIALFPLWAGLDKPAKRVILQGRKGTQGSLRLHPGLMLHEPGGRYTIAAEDILRNGKALQI